MVKLHILYDDGDTDTFLEGMMSEDEMRAVMSDFEEGVNKILFSYKGSGTKVLAVLNSTKVTSIAMETEEAK